MEKTFRWKIIVVWLCLVFMIALITICMIFQEPLLDLFRADLVGPDSSQTLRNFYYPRFGEKFAVPFYMIFCTIIEIIFSSIVTNVCLHEEKWTNWRIAKGLLIGRIVTQIIETVLSYIYMFGFAFVLWNFYHPLMDTITSLIVIPVSIILAVFLLILIIQIMIRAGKHNR